MQPAINQLAQPHPQPSVAFETSRLPDFNCSFCALLARRTSFDMASNNPSTCNLASSRLIYRSGPTSPPAPGNAQVPAYDSDGLEIDDDTLLALSSLPKMETNRASRQNEDGNFQDKAIVSATAVFDDNSSGCLDVVQQAIDAVEDALARCPKYERREALTELLMHAKLEQAKKATAFNSDCFQHANVWAAMLMQVQELGRNYPKEYESSPASYHQTLQRSHICFWFLSCSARRSISSCISCSSA